MIRRRKTESETKDEYLGWYPFTFLTLPAPAWSPAEPHLPDPDGQVQGCSLSPSSPVKGLILQEAHCVAEGHQQVGQPQANWAGLSQEALLRDTEEKSCVKP